MVSVRAWEPRILNSNPRYPLTTFHYLISPPSGQRLPKLLPYCPQTGLITLICIWGCSSNKAHTFSRENLNIRGIYTKIKIIKPTPNNRQGKSICASICLLETTVNDIENKNIPTISKDLPAHIPHPHQLQPLHQTLIPLHSSPTYTLEIHNHRLHHTWLDTSDNRWQTILPLGPIDSAAMSDDR